MNSMRLVSSLLTLSLLGTGMVMPGLEASAKSKKPESKQEQKQEPKKPAKTDKKAKAAAALAKSPQAKARPPLPEETQKAIADAAEKLDPETRNSLVMMAESVKQQDRAIYNELRDDEELATVDIGMLWQAAVERSGTIRYAIEKLSRRDATGKPVENDSFSKRVLQNLVQLGGVAGSMWTGTPAGVLGSGMIQDLMAGNPQDSALSRVTDADMVILAKEVEALQSQLIELYYNYRHAQEKLALAEEASGTVAKYYAQAEATQGAANSEALQPLMQSIYESAKQDEQSARQGVVSARTALSLVVGPDALAALEQTHQKKQ